MAVPSSLYAEDENARQTLANGTVLKWTKKNSEIYSAPNVETDRSICYCNWAGELDYANRGFHQWQGGCATGDDLGHNGCEGAGFENLHANSLKQNEFGQPRMDGLYTGVVLTNADGDGAYVWGYNPESSSCINSSNGADRRYLLDMDINKMIFNITINVYDKADFDAIDYINSNNPESYQQPGTHNITLKQLYENPDDYYVDSFNWGTTYIYGENTSDHWRGALVYPAHIINGETVGQFKGTKNLSIFGMHYAAGNFSYDNSDPMNPNAHPTFGGGGATPVIYNNMNSGYFMGCGKDINLNPVYSYSAVGTSAESIAQYKWGTATSWNHNAYVNQEFFDYGDSVIWCAYGAHAYYNSNTSESKYREYFFFTRKMLKGQYALDYIASFGLYFASETFDPDTPGLTPETLGDDSRIMLGEMSADGTTTGRWITDIDSYTGPNKDGKTINPDYNPSGGGGSVDDEDNDDPVNTTGAPFAAGLCNYYAMTAGSPLLDHISEALGTWDIENTHKDLYKNLVSCKLVKPPAPIPTTGSAPFTIYGVKPQYAGADISLPVVSGNPEATFGPYQISRKFNDFRDYAPYTRVSIYLPYCGWCDLPSHVVGRQVSVKYFTDIIAATCKSVVFCGNNIVAEAAGVIGLDIPFVADNVGAKMQAVTAGMIAALGGGIQLGAGIGTMVSTKSGSGAKAALSGASQYLSGYSQMAMAFNENTTEISGKNGDGCCLAGATNIIIKIVRPKKGAYTDAPYTPPGYGHGIGFVSQKQVKVSSVSGLLIADNVDTSGISGATEAERAEIKRVLETGLIVNAAPNTGE